MPPKNKKVTVPEKRVAVSMTIEMALTANDVMAACREWAARRFGGCNVGSVTIDKNLSNAVVAFDLDYDDESGGNELRGATVIVHNEVVADDPET